MGCHIEDTLPRIRKRKNFNVKLKKLFKITNGPCHTLMGFDNGTPGAFKKSLAELGFCDTNSGAREENSFRTKLKLLFKKKIKKSYLIAYPYI